MRLLERQRASHSDGNSASQDAVATVGPFLSVSGADAQADGPDGGFTYSLTSAVTGGPYTAPTDISIDASISATPTSGGTDYTALQNAVIPAGYSSVTQDIHALPDATGDPVGTATDDPNPTPPQLQAPPSPTTLTSTPNATTQYAVAPATQSSANVNPAVISELDVADANNPNNAIASTQQIIQELYIVGTSTGLNSYTASIDLDSVTAPYGAKVVYNVTGDGAALFAGTEFTLTPALLGNPTVRQTSDYYITACLSDANGNPIMPPQQSAEVVLISPVQFSQTTPEVDVDPTGGGDFDKSYIQFARWSRTYNPKKADAGNTGVWQAVGSQYGQTIYVFNPAVTTYTDVLLPGGDTSWDIVQMATDTLNFDDAAEAHENQVIGWVRDIWSPVVFYPSGEDPTAALKAAYIARADQFSADLATVEHGFVLGMRNLLLDIVTFDTNMDPAFHDIVTKLDNLIGGLH